MRRLKFPDELEEIRDGACGEDITAKIVDAWSKERYDYKHCLWYIETTIELERKGRKFKITDLDRRVGSDEIEDDINTNTKILRKLKLIGRRVLIRRYSLIEQIREGYGDWLTTTSSTNYKGFIMWDLQTKKPIKLPFSSSYCLEYSHLYFEFFDLGNLPRNMRYLNIKR